jgi:glycolate oxidase FAD binding subunit
MLMSNILADSVGNVAGRTAETVFVPETMGELQEIVRARDGMTLVPAGGRTRLDLGEAPGGRFGVLDVTRAIRGAIVHEADDLTVEAPASSTLSELNEVLAARGQWLPLDPPFADRATIGGVLAVGTGGPLRGRFGLPRDFLLGATTLRADGELVKAGGRVVKNVTGYDLLRLWCGSLGTLGVFTAVALRVYPRKETVDLVVERDAFEEAAELATQLYVADVRPEVADIRLVEGRWRLFMRVPVAAAGIARSITGGRIAEDAEAEYRECRDLGWRDGEVFTLRFATSATKVAAAVRELMSGGATGIVARPVAGTAIGTWGEAALEEAKKSAGVVGRLRAMVSSEGGSVVVERMPDGWRGAVDAWGMPQNGLQLMRRVKEQYDPDGRFNRGRFAGGI